MFAGIEKVKWNKYKSRCMRTKLNPEPIPGLFRNLLSSDNQIRSVSLNKISDLTVCNDQIAYFTDAAVPIMPFLMEYFASEYFKGDAKLFEMLSMGLMLVEEFADSFAVDVSPRLQQSYASILATIRPYLSEFYPYLTHRDGVIRRDVMFIVICFPEESEQSIPVLLDALEVIINDYGDTRSTYLGDIQYLFSHSFPTEKQIKRFIELAYNMFKLSLENIADGKIFSDVMPLWIARELNQNYSNQIPDEIKDYLKQHET